MTSFLLVAGVISLLTAAIGLLRLIGPLGATPRQERRSAASSAAQPMMAAQLLGTATIAALLLVGTALGLPATVDLALVLSLLAPFAVVGLASIVRHGEAPAEDGSRSQASAGAEETAP